MVALTFAPGKRRLTVYVVFHGSFQGGFWTFLTPRPWRHCLLLMTIYFPEPSVFARRYTLVFEPTAWGLEMDVVWRDPEAVARDYWRAGCTAIVKTSVTVPPLRVFAVRGSITCVSLIKAVLGIFDWRIITPRHLFRRLMRDGGELMQWGEGDGEAYRGISRDGAEAAGSGQGDLAGSSRSEPAPTGA